MLDSIEANSMFMEEIEAKQFEDGNLDELRMEIAIGNYQETTLDADWVINHYGGICVPQVDELIQYLLVESHGSRYSIHPGLTEICRDLKRIYWWLRMKKYIVEFMEKCQNFQ